MLRFMQRGKEMGGDCFCCRESINRLRNLVMEGTTQQAKYAMIVLAHMKESRSLCVEIIEV